MLVEALELLPRSGHAAGKGCRVLPPERPCDVLQGQGRILARPEQDKAWSEESWARTGPGQEGQGGPDQNWARPVLASFAVRFGFPVWSSLPVGSVQFGQGRFDSAGSVFRFGSVWSAQFTGPVQNSQIDLLHQSGLLIMEKEMWDFLKGSKVSFMSFNCLY